MEEINGLIHSLQEVRDQLQFIASELKYEPYPECIRIGLDALDRFENAEHWLVEYINAHPDTLQLS